MRLISPRPLLGVGILLPPFVHSYIVKTVKGVTFLVFMRKYKGGATICVILLLFHKTGGRNVDGEKSYSPVNHFCVFFMTNDFFNI
jgi:hypothetical protein